jgi:tripeptidyl-peptidase I
LHHQTGVRKLGSDHYSIPQEIQAHVDYITPAATKLRLRGYGTTEKMSNAMSDLTDIDTRFTNDCSRYITPRCIRKIYGIPLGNESVPGNDIGIYSEQTYNQANLDTFFEKLAPFIPTGTKPVINRIDGAQVFGKPSYLQLESMLDLDMVYPIVYPQNVRQLAVDDWYYNNKVWKKGLFNTFLDALDGSYCTRTAFNETGDNPKFDPVYPDHHKHGYNHTEMCGTFKPPNVISISYGNAESARTVNYDRRQCSEWMKLALQGVTVVQASGDSGVEDNFRGCIKNSDGKRKIFSPLISANCPYVVAVGATLLPAGNATEAKNQVAARSFGSG